MTVPVVADADTLFGGTTRGLLIHLDYLGLIRLHWSELILAEMSRALVKHGRKRDTAAAKAHEALMNRSVPHAAIDVALVQAQFKTVAPAVRSVKDTHVAACAAALLALDAYPHSLVVNLVTHNTKDYGVRKLAELSVLVRRPDAFLLALWEEEKKGLAAAFRELRRSLVSQPSPDALLARLAADGQVRLAAAMRAAQRAGDTVL